jgi:hypothetical protein
MARQAAERCKAEDLVQVVGTESKGKAVQELVAITPRGLERLLQDHEPRQVLEDFVRAVEAREKQLADLAAAARQAQGHLDALRSLAAAALERVCGPSQPDAAALVPALLDGWHAAHPDKDCPLPQLFRQLQAEAPELSIGAFHDALRALHTAGRLWLHPWTGPLYDLPEPPLALLVGHEVAYYASPRNGA